MGLKLRIGDSCRCGWRRRTGLKLLRGEGNCCYYCCNLGVNITVDMIGLLIASGGRAKMLALPGERLLRV